MTPNVATINVALDTDFNTVGTGNDRRSDRNRERNTLAPGRDKHLQTTTHRVSDPVNMTRSELRSTVYAAILDDLDDPYDFAQLDELDAISDELDNLEVAWDDTSFDDDSDLFRAEDDSLWAEVAAMMATPITR